MKLIDSHCHLDDDRFDPQRTEIIARAAECGVVKFVVPATTTNRWDKIRQLARSVDEIYPAYGLHPMFVAQHRTAHLIELDEWLDREKPVAVGECGIDFFQSRVDQTWQRQLFSEQIQLANNHHLPLIVHARKALDEVIEILRRDSRYGGVIHSFSGSLQQAKRLFGLGFKLGIAATVGFDRAKKLRAVVASMPVESLVLESDAPDQSGPAHRGELNQPAVIIDHLQVISKLRETDAETLALALNRNCEQLFSLQDHPA